jgi:glycosyltransferase involved in cell wall biosynthesis
MSTPQPLVSIVIPTHDRQLSVVRALDALTRQTFDPSLLDVIVAANGCTGGTVAALRRLETPYSLRILDLPVSGASAARNAGAEAARAPLVVFLDDDVEAAPGFVEAHLAAHGLRDRHPSSPLPLRVAIGYLPATLQPEHDFFAIALRGWWESMFDRMRQPGHRWGYTDLLSGNFSIPREHFLRLGGFDPRFRCHEDYELGHRLILEGTAFVFVESAWGHHDDRTRVRRACERKRDESHADVQLAGLHPELRPALLLTRRSSWKQRVMRGLAFLAPRLGNAVAGVLERLLGPLERVGARSSWRRVLYAIFGYWYERGAAEAAGSHRALRDLLADVWRDPRLVEPGLVLDVADVGAAERRLDRERPRAVTLAVNGRPFGRIPCEPGTEPLAGRHLGPALVQTWHRPYVKALVAENMIPLLASPDMSAPRPAVGAAARSDRAGLMPCTAPPPRTTQ